MRAPRKPFRPQPLDKPKRAVAGASALLLAVLLGAVVIGVGSLRAPRSLDPRRAPLPASATVNLNPQDQSRLDDWSEFFACHGLVNSNAVMLATMRANGGAWRPERPIRLELAPSVDQPPATPAEDAILVRAAHIANAEPGERDAACSVHAAPPVASSAAAETPAQEAPQ